MNHSWRATLSLILAAAAVPLAATGPACAAKPTSTHPKPKPSASVNTPDYVLPPIVATVNGVPVTRQQVDVELERNYADKVIFALVLNHLLDQRAAELHVTPTRSAIKDAYMQADKDSHGQLNTILENHKMSPAQFEQLVLKPRLEMQNIEKHGINVTEANIVDFYNQNKAQWAEPDKLDLQRMHVATRADADAAEADLAGGKAWVDVFTKYSDDKEYYKATDGSYGEVLRKTLPKEVADIIDGLKPGGISKPMPITENGPDKGFVIWKVNNIVPGSTPTLQQKRTEIVARLQAQKTPQEIDIIRQLVRSAKIKGLPAAYEQEFAMFSAPQPAPPHPGMPTDGGMTPPSPPAEDGG